MRVLLQALVANLAEFEQFLDGEKWIFYGGAHLRCGFVLGLLSVRQRRVASSLLVDEILGLGRVRFALLALPPVGRIAPHPV